MLLVHLLLDWESFQNLLLRNVAFPEQHPLLPLIFITIKDKLTFIVLVNENKYNLDSIICVLVLTRYSD